MEERPTLKEILTGALGTFGFVLFLLIQLVVSVLPLVMLPVKGFFLWFLIAFVMYVFPITDVIFWVWGLVCAIGGVQDWLAILYYVCFAVLFLPTFISALLSLIDRLKN